MGWTNESFTSSHLSLYTDSAEELPPHTLLPWDVKGTTPSPHMASHVTSSTWACPGLVRWPGQQRCWAGKPGDVSLISLTHMCTWYPQCLHPLHITSHITFFFKMEEGAGEIWVCSQRPNAGSQSSVTPVPGNPTFFSDRRGHQAPVWCTCHQTFLHCK